MISRIVFIAVVVSTIWSVHGQEAGGEGPTTSPITSLATSSFNFNPIGIVLGAIGGNFEHLFAGRHGMLLQGGYMVGNTVGGYAVAAQYRYHYFTKPVHSGLNSPFWGPFVYYEQSNTEIEDPNTSDKYDVDIQYLKVGANWGRRWIFGKSFNLVFRIGYGLPIVANFDWAPLEPAEAADIEGLTKVVAGIDGELSMGIAF